LVKDSGERPVFFQKRKELTLFLLEYMEPKISVQTAIQLARLYEQKMLYGVTYPQEIEDTLNLALERITTLNV